MRSPVSEKTSAVRLGIEQSQPSLAGIASKGSAAIRLGSGPIRVRSELIRLGQDPSGLGQNPSELGQNLSDWVRTHQVG